jgi:DNA-binding SARP family transcriptional activator
MTPPQKVFYAGSHAHALHNLLISGENELSLHFFGTFGLSVNRTKVDFNWQARMLFAYLASQAPRALSRDHLARVFWPSKHDSQPESARRSLNVELNHVRKAIREQTNLPDNLIVFENNCYRLQWPANPRSDVADFKNACRKIQVSSHAGTPPTEAQLWQTLQLCNGAFLEDCPQDALNWVEIERQHLGVLFEQMADQYLALCEARGDHAHVIAVCHEWLARDLRQESLHRRLMRSFEKLGLCNKVEAQYRLLCQILEQEYQAKPSAETTRLFLQIRERCG